MRRCIFLVVPLVVLAACNRADDRAGTTGLASQPRDSAGVRIMSYHLGQPQEHRVVTWTIAPSPVLHVGVAIGDSTQELAGVAGAAMLEDGRLAIGLHGSHDVRLYSATGAFVRSMGREGNGPGEFRSVAGPWRLGGDRLAVYDIRARRISVFDTSGALRRSMAYAPDVRVDSASILTALIGFVGGGTALGMATRLDPPRVGVHRGSFDYVLLDSTGHVRGSAGPYRGPETYIGPPTNGFMALGTPPFKFTTLAAAGNGVIAVAGNAAYEIRLMTPTGAVKTIIRADVVPEPVSDADFREFAEERAARFGTSVTDKGVEMLHEMSVHEFAPVLDTLMFDHGNDLWTVEFAHPGAKARRVAVYDTTGALRGAFELPTTMTLLSVEADRIVVLMRDESGAEMVNVFDIITSAGGEVSRSGSLEASGASTHLASTSRSTPAVVSTTG